MKILYISSSTIPSRTANSIHVMKMCQAFAKNGHKVILFARKNNEEMGGRVNDAFFHYGIESKFRIKRIPYWNIFGRSLLYAFFSVIKVKSIKPDLVYSRNIICGYLAAVLRIPVIIECHAPPEQEGLGKKKFLSLLLKSRELKKVVVITNSLKQYFCENFPKAKNIIQVHPDASEHFSADTKAMEFPRDVYTFHAGYVGHLYNGKGMELIIHLAESSPDIAFHIVGGLEADIDFWEKKCADINNVFFHGYVRHSMAKRYILAFDVALLPNQLVSSSLEDMQEYIEKWTSPLKMFEYMAGAKPIIASDLPVLREVLKHERNALLCPPDDPEKWKTALERIRDDSDLAKRIAQTALDDFLNNYTWQTRAKRVLEQRAEGKGSA